MEINNELQKYLDRLSKDDLAGRTALKYVYNVIFKRNVEERKAEFARKYTLIPTTEKYGRGMGPLRRYIPDDPDDLFIGFHGGVKDAGMYEFPYWLNFYVMFNYRRWTKYDDVNKIINDLIMYAYNVTRNKSSDGNILTSVEYFDTILLEARNYFINPRDEDYDDIVTKFPGYTDMLAHLYGAGQVKTSVNENVKCIDIKDIFNDVINDSKRMWVYRDTGKLVIGQSDDYELTVEDMKRIFNGLKDGTIVIDPLWNTNNKRRYNVDLIKEALSKSYADASDNYNQEPEHNNSSKTESSEEKHTPSSNEDNAVTIPFKVNIINSEDYEFCPRIADGRIVSIDICRKKKD